MPYSHVGPRLQKTWARLFHTYARYDQSTIDPIGIAMGFYLLPDEFETKQSYVDFLLEKHENLALWVYDPAVAAANPNNRKFEDEELCIDCGKRLIRMVPVSMVFDRSTHDLDQAIRDDLKIDDCHWRH